VCKCNGDLGCLIVRIDATTPRAEYRGETYYFCSEDCKKEFEAKPAKYVK
jgi:YHS domain-containing protein